MYKLGSAHFPKVEIIEAQRNSPSSSIDVINTCLQHLSAEEVGSALSAT